MAFSITQAPHELVAVNSPIIYVSKETTPAIVNNVKFRYIFDVQINETDDSGAGFSSIGKIKVHANNSSAGIVDISKLIKSYLETQKIDLNSTTNTIHKVGVNVPAKIFSGNTEQIITVRVVASYEYATNIDLAPVEQTGIAVTSGQIHCTLATTLFTQGISRSLVNNPLSDYQFADNTKKFLTNAPDVQFVRGSSTSGDNIDKLTMAFFQKGQILLTNAVTYIAINYFASDDSQIGSEQLIEVNSTNGGSANPSNANATDLLYVGVGPANLENSTVTPNGGSSGDAAPSNFSNWAYYTVHADFGASQISKTYKFYRYGASRTGIDDRHQSCTKYNNVRICWSNRLGAWDYINFRGKSKEDVAIKRTQIGKVIGTWNSDSFTYNNFEGKTENIQTTAKKTITVNSDFLNEDEAEWIEELFTSQYVQIIQDDGLTIPVIVKSNSYTKKTSLNNKIKIQYTLKLELSNDIRTNT